MSYLLAETGGLLLASMILGCALGYLVGTLRGSSADGSQSYSLAPAGQKSAMADDDRMTYEDNVRRARAEIVRLEKQNNRLNSALEAARAMPAPVAVAAGGDATWDRASTTSDHDHRLVDLESELARRDTELAQRDADLERLHERNEEVEEALTVRDHEIEELEDSVRVMHQRVTDAEASSSMVQGAETPMAITGSADHGDHGDAAQLRTELEQARTRLIRLDERQLELDQMVSRLRGPAARAERLEAETARLRDRLRLRETRLRELEGGLPTPSAAGGRASAIRPLAGRRSGKQVRSSGPDATVARRQPASSPAERARNVAELTSIEGIGPVLARMLDQRGVSSLADLAQLSDADVANLEAQLPEFATRIRRDRWVEQAQHTLSKRNIRASSRKG